jgi:hypothetical protein
LTISRAAIVGSTIDFMPKSHYLKDAPTHSLTELEEDSGVGSFLSNKVLINVLGIFSLWGYSVGWLRILTGH